jgi:hypothetical protein
MKLWTLVTLIATTLTLTCCSSPASKTPSAAPAAAPSSATSAGNTALGNRKAPFGSTTALSVIAAAKAAGLSTEGPAQEDAALCAEYKGCRSAALTGSVKIVVFETAVAAQQYRDTSDGALIENIGGRRYWSLVDYRELGPEQRSAWRDVQRKIIP